MYISSYVVLRVPVLFTSPSATAITTHWSAVLSGWIVQVTVMLYSSLVTLGEMGVTEVLVTGEATGHDWNKYKNYITAAVYLQ